MTRINKLSREWKLYNDFHSGILLKQTKQKLL